MAPWQRPAAFAVGGSVLLLPLLELPAVGADVNVPRPTNKACRNPLFEKHWFSPGGAPESLCQKPKIDSDLRLCPAYNGLPSCCQESFESEQQLHFSYWRQILKAKIMQVKQAKTSTEKVDQDPAFNAASDEDRQQFRIALQKYEKILDPSVGQARCFAAMLVYTAGMICFGCKPDWINEVQMDGGKLVRVLVNSGSCSDLWADCQDFGLLARDLREAILDSSLAIRSSAPVEHLRMFEDQQLLCDFAHNVIAMHPFTQPSETEREATPPVTEIARRRLDSQEISYATGKKEYDTMKAGRASGFDMTWDGLIAQSLAARSRALGAAGLALAAALFA